MRSEPRTTDFYATHGSVTGPGEYAEMLQSLPPDIRGICAVLRGLLIHPRELGMEWSAMNSRQRGEIELVFVRDILARIALASSLPLHIQRKPEERITGHCRHFAVLLTAALRQRGIPARVRVGFATYFPSAMNEDHWLCEYWNRREERWVLVDGQLESHPDAYRVADFSNYDVPRSRFVVAGRAWSECRRGKADPRMFGFSKKLRGYECISESLLRDMAALNKVELLPWTRLWMGITQGHMQPENRAMLDTLAELTQSDNCNFDGLVSMTENELSLCGPLIEDGLLHDAETRLEEPVLPTFTSAGVRGHMWAVLQTALYSEKVA